MNWEEWLSLLLQAVSNGHWPINATHAWWHGEMVIFLWQTYTHILTKVDRKGNLIIKEAAHRHLCEERATYLWSKMPSSRFRAKHVPLTIWHSWAGASLQARKICPFCEGYSVIPDSVILSLPRPAIFLLAISHRVWWAEVFWQHSGTQSHTVNCNCLNYRSRRSAFCL